jgi:CheY-like chemotaxis protein
VIGILAQRLVRSPCPACKVSQPPSADAIEKAGGASRLPADAKWIAGRGCEDCRQSGSKGRVAIHELLVVNDEVRELISQRASEHAIRKAARNAGMHTLLEDGILKAAQGLTTLEDVVRVVAADDTSAHKEDATKPKANSSVPGDGVATPQQAAEQSTATAGFDGDAQEMQIELHVTSPPPRSEAGKPGETQGKERVLVVEDSTTIASVVKYFLELEGFEVLVAKNGNLGLKAAKRDLPDVIVTDYDMPGMDGITMVKALRAEASTREIAVLMLTSEQSVEREAQALEAGVDDYILKPVEPRRLAARVRSVLARSQRRHTAVL